jgi:hypothetical protein
VPANSNNKWTPEEDKRLLELQAAGKSSFLAAAELRRSVGSVRGRLAILKARERFASNPGATQSEMPLRKRWTLDDDKRLMEWRAKGVSFNEIATALGRTEAAVEQRAHTLKRPVKPRRGICGRRTEAETVEAATCVARVAF